MWLRQRPAILAASASRGYRASRSSARRKAVGTSLFAYAAWASMRAGACNPCQKVSPITPARIRLRSHRAQPPLNRGVFKPKTPLTPLPKREGTRGRARRRSATDTPPWGRSITTAKAHLSSFHPAPAQGSRAASGGCKQPPGDSSGRFPDDPRRRDFPS
jgi:hypothetical protein